MRELIERLPVGLRVGITGFVAVLCLFFLRACHKKATSSVPSRTMLPGNDKELITYDERRHVITVTTTKGTTHSYSRNPTVEIRKDGTTRVNSHGWGSEFQPFLGVGYSDTGRAYLGCHLLYLHRFDAGAAIGWTADNRWPALQPVLSVGYNFWSNTSINVGLDPVSFIGPRKTEIAVFLSVRL